MSFNPEPLKQAQEVIFTRKLQKKDYPPLYFNDSSVKETCTQKYLGMLLGFRLDFQEHWKSLLKEVNKTVALLCKFQNIPLYFNGSSVKETCTQKHIGMLLDLRLDFQEHWKSLLKEVNKTVALLRKFQNILPRSALLTIYKCFVGTHLDYGDIIYDQAFSNSFHQKIYQGLGLESLQQRRPS